MVGMHAVLAGLTTLDVFHQLDDEPEPLTKTTSSAQVLAAGGPATNAAVTIAVLAQIKGHVGDPVDLLTTIGTGPAAALVNSELEGLGVTALDAADPETSGSGLAISSVLDHPGGRQVVSTNARLDVDRERAEQLIVDSLKVNGDPDVVLVDGHNPTLADLVVRLGTGGDDLDAPQRDSPFGASDPFAEQIARPSHLRILDGGSWKPWAVPLLGFIDVAIVSADFVPPVATDSSDAEVDPEGVASFLRGFGIVRTIRTDGAHPVRWWWEGHSGEVAVSPPDAAVSTTGAGDIFHGALAWALGRLHEAGADVPSDPSDLIRFSSAVAGLSVRSFGTREWITDPALAELVAPW